MYYVLHRKKHQTEPVPVSAATTRLLLHGQTYTDSSKEKHSLMTSGNVYIMDIPRFGTSSLVFNGGYITTRITNSLCVYSFSHFSVDMWVRFPKYNNLSERNGPPNLIGMMNPHLANNDWSFGPNCDGNLTFYFYNGKPNFVYSASVLPLNVWNHIAFTRIDNTIRLFVNGRQDGEGDFNQFGGKCHTSNTLTIGGYNGTSYTGTVDEVRLTSGERELWEKDFNPPTGPYALIEK